MIREQDEFDSLVSSPDWIVLYVEKLRLEKEPIPDVIGKHLEGLKYLEALNLNETKISADCVNSLRQKGTIKRIYTWKTMSDRSK